MQNIINALDLNDLISNVFTLSLLGCLFLHLLLTKNQRLVTFCFALVLIQFLNWVIYPVVWSHEYGAYIWYVTWMVTDILVLLYVAIRAVLSGKVLKEELAVSLLTVVAILFYIARFVERHFTDLTIIKVVQAYAIPAVNICIILALLTPVAKQLVVTLGRKINGITIFGLRFSVSSVRSSAVLANPESLSRTNRRSL